MTDGWLHAQNEEEKRYLYCHCPWARESIKSNSGIPQVSSTFCNCSAGFVKKPFEIIYNQTLPVDIVQSILNGDDVCEFAISLPK
jgi:predicted hydrocarbon binding protein